jgi:hypothetical protein
LRIFGYVMQKRSRQRRGIQMVFRQIISDCERVDKKKLARFTALVTVFPTSEGTCFPNAPLVLYVKVAVGSLEKLRLIKGNVLHHSP